MDTLKEHANSISEEQKEPWIKGWWPSGSVLRRADNDLSVNVLAWFVLWGFFIFFVSCRKLNFIYADDFKICNFNHTAFLDYPLSCLLQNATWVSHSMMRTLSQHLSPQNFVSVSLPVISKLYIVSGSTFPSVNNLHLLFTDYSSWIFSSGVTSPKYHYCSTSHLN